VQGPYTTSGSRGTRNQRPDVSAIVVHYEIPELLARCLTAVRAAEGSLLLETLVVDNASRGLSQPASTRRCPACG
jgi:GT2 family glycosyltransferase